MSLAALMDGLRRRSAYRRLVEAVRAGQAEPLLLDPLEGAKPFVVAALWRDLGRPVLWLHPGADDARRAHDQVTAYVSPSAVGSVLLFPEPDALPYERLTNDATTTRDRLRVLASLVHFQDTARELRLQEVVSRPAPLIVANGYAAAQTTIPTDLFRQSARRLAVGDDVSMDDLIGVWLSLGYEPAPAVEMPGTFSRRGGIVDVWPPQAGQPVRVELFGRRVESMRSFDVGTQRSVEHLEAVAITPAKEVIPAAATHMPDIDLSGLPPDQGRVFRDDVLRFAEGAAVPGIEFYGPLFQRTILLDYLPEETVIVIDRPGRLRANLEEVIRRGDEIRDNQIERGTLPATFPSPVASRDRMEQSLADVPRRVHLEPFSGGSPATERTGRSFGGLGFSPAESYGGKIPELSDDLVRLRRSGQAAVIASLQAQRLAEMLQEAGHDLALRDDLDVAPSPGSLTVVRTGVAEGWDMPQGNDAGTDNGIVLLTDTEIFGFVKRARPIRRRVVRRDAFLSDFSEGDHVVHVEHGVALFSGTVERDLNGAEREYLVLKYAGSDTLYVPTDQMDRVTRYVGTGGTPSLSRLGGTEWTNTKRRVKEDALEFARELLRRYAAREVEQRPAFDGDTPWQWELESSFPYRETKDQLAAIADLKADMESDSPMDRLVCGDVGYGKTEVALRAAFKAVAQGTQVAVLVPTTVLAQQHLRSFQERLETFPIRVGLLSRLRTDAEQRETVAALARGDVDVVIGTHRLLSKDVAFKNLGLVIIDEEQRFGVGHKEHLRKMRATVDVLTMTATPIPRTLHMALFGIRDMSRIDTPPEERIPVATFVAEYEDRTVREAILRETDRGGQVFFVHNRVQDIHRIAQQLRELVPEASFEIAHGRMAPDALEHVMDSFTAGEVDVLVCTTIIQSGLDIPNANTLIADESDKLGLTQLYQLRGRVGRSSLRAYAYFLFKRDRVLTHTAEQRLRAIVSAADIGAGFRIAMKDLEIRGAGNILGSEQSGNVAAVGFDLYTRLLAEAVEEARGSDAASTPLPGHNERAALMAPGAPRAPVDLPVDAHIPADYIADTGTRLAVYERLVNVRNPDDVGHVHLELVDRFGPAPQAVDDLLLAVELRALSGHLQGMVRGISRESTDVVVRLRDVSWLDRDRLRRALPDVEVGHLQVRISQRQSADWRKDVLGLMRELGGMVTARASAGVAGGSG